MLIAKDSIQGCQANGKKEKTCFFQQRHWLCIEQAHHERRGRAGSIRPISPAVNPLKSAEGYRASSQVSSQGFAFCAKWYSRCQTVANGKNEKTMLVLAAATKEVELMAPKIVYCLPSGGA
jgi:hypothetical protein